MTKNEEEPKFVSGKYLVKQVRPCIMIINTANSADRAEKMKLTYQGTINEKTT